MDASIRLAVAAVFVWLGMVLAISFVEAPLKFRAPGVTPRIGLGIGRLVFRALNVFEFVFAVIIAVALFTHETSTAFNIGVCVAVGALLTQSVLVRPLMVRTSFEALDGGEEGQRSWAHYAYVVLEVAKVVALVWMGVQLVG